MAVKQITKMTLKELKSEVETRYHILLRAILFYNYSKYLNHPDTSGEKECADRSVFIRRIRYAFWFLCVLELCKIFGNKDTDKFRFKKLFNKLKYRYSSAPWREKLSKAQIEIWEHSFGEEMTIQCIRKLEGLRDQYYAHSDKHPDKEIDELTPDFQEVECLITFGKKIILEISEKVFESDKLFEVPISERAENILNKLLKSEQLIREEELKDVHRLRDRIS